MDEKPSDHKDVVETDARKTIDNLLHGHVRSPTLRDLERAVKRASQDRAVGDMGQRHV